MSCEVYGAHLVQPYVMAQFRTRILIWILLESDWSQLEISGTMMSTLAGTSRLDDISD